MEQELTHLARNKAFHEAFGYGDEDPAYQKDTILEKDELISLEKKLDDLIWDINLKYFYVVIGKNGYVAYKDFDTILKRRVISYLVPKAFHEYFAARKFPYEEETEEGKIKIKYVPLTKLWMEHPKRRSYKGIVFAPEEVVPLDKFNLWQDFRGDAREGDCQPFLDFVFEVICSGNKDHYNYVLAWMADAVQNLTAGEKPGVALVLRGERGTGKGFFARSLGSIFKQYFVHIFNPKHLTGNFNRHLQDCLLLFADEIDGSRKNMGILQGLITEPTIPVEIKGKDVFQALNYMRLIVASNSDWVVPAGPNERRWLVLDVSDCHMQDTAYFANLDTLMKNGGREAMLHYLLHYDYSKINLRQIPKTCALADQVISSMDSIDSYWHSLLQRGSYPGPQGIESEWGSEVMVKDMIYKDFQETLKGRRVPIPNDTAFWTKVRKRCPSLKEVRPGGKRAFEVPLLNNARDLFDKSFGHKFPWEEVT